MSTNEAFWRIFSFQIHEHHPTVVHLAVHLENGQRIYFTAATMHARALTPPRTTLTAFFTLGSEDSFARPLLYTEEPAYYVWSSSILRKQGTSVEGHQNLFSSDTLGRLYSVGCIRIMMSVSTYAYY